MTARRAGAFAAALLALAACGGGEETAPATVSASEDAAPLGAPPPAGEATAATRAVNAAVAARLALDDPADAADAARGWIAAIDAPAIVNADGDPVWRIDQFDFLAGPAPDTVNPSLWRQSRLAARHGLFDVTDGIWQVRGYDLSVMSVIAGDTGWIIVDPLTTTETAAAALKLVNDTLGERPVSAVIYTHSHIDHFGGARGIISEEEIAARGVPVLAPIGFSENAVAENLIAGPHMTRRASLMFGFRLARSATGHVGAGLGPATPQGTYSLILPTEEIDGRGEPRLVDGVTFVFIDAGGTEAPAEFMFYLPEKRALCTAEVATATLHNVLTPRGAKVRDALKWSRAIDHVLSEYGDRADVAFGSHHWPTWGTADITTWLARQRDAYRYVHDQTVRRANSGATMDEAAEAIAEPALQSEGFDARGYYGTLNHDAKAVYQHYFGWWSGVPADYYALPHETTAPRYVAAMGGRDAALALGAAAFEAGDYRWAAEVFNHVVFAEPGDAEARAWLAAAYEQIGFQAESGAWRSYYLAAAQELREGPPRGAAPTLGNAEFLRAVPSLQLFDALAARYDPTALARDPFALAFAFTDTGEAVTLHVGRDVIAPRDGLEPGAAATVTMERALFDRVLLRDVNFRNQVLAGAIQIEGDRGAVRAFFTALETPEPWFAVATP